MALGLVTEVPFAFEAAGSETGKGVEHAQEVERIELEGLTERVGADFGDGFADEGGGDFMGGLEDVDALFLAGEVEGEFVAQAGFVEEAEFAEVVLVAALFPAANGVVGEVYAVFAELLEDGRIWESVVKHLVDLVAKGF